VDRSSTYIYEFREDIKMSVLKAVLLILYIIDGIALNVVILMQEGKDAGLSGAISGVAETYWGKNKGRSMEGGLVLATRITAVLFILLSLVLNLEMFS
jgi:preprotein translocase subunit SecG